MYIAFIKGKLMFLKKVLSIKEPQLTRRLFNGGFENMGHVKRGSDTRTTEQLLENIDYYAKICPEVAQFKDELKSMNPKHLGLVSDICELANHYEFLNTAINIKKPAANGKSLFQFLLEKLPKASEENPASVDLSQEIINNTDATAAKYALGSLSPLYDCKDAAQHIEATIPLVSDIAESTLKGGYLMDYSKEQNFVNGIKSFISPNVLLEKLRMLSKIIKIADKSNATCQIDAFPFVTNNTPMNIITKNLEMFKVLDKSMEGKTINLTEFLEKNVNIQ